MQQPENNRTNFAAMTFVTALCPFKITQGPCSATKDAIYTLISLPLSAVGGEATEETPGVLLKVHKKRRKKRKKLVLPFTPTYVQ